MNRNVACVRKSVIPFTILRVTIDVDTHFVPEEKINLEVLYEPPVLEGHMQFFEDFVKDSFVLGGVFRQDVSSHWPLIKSRRREIL